MTATVTVTGTLRQHRAVREAWATGYLRVAESSDAERAPVGRELVVVGARLGLAAVGEQLRLTGALEDDPRWGRQLQVQEQESLGIRSPSDAHRWLERLDGVGPKLAERIGAELGDRVLEVLQHPPGPGEPDPLLEVEGIGPLLVQTIRESWGELGASGDPETLRYLDGLGLTRWEVNNVIRWAKERHRTAKELLEEDPWGLCEVKGFGFKRADSVALKAGASREAPTRLDAAVAYQVERSCASHTVVSWAQLTKDTCELTGCRGALVSEAIQRAVGRGVALATEDERGGWVHPTELLRAERKILRAVRRAAGGAPAAAPAPKREPHWRIAPLCRACQEPLGPAHNALHPWCLRSELEANGQTGKGQDLPAGPPTAELFGVPRPAPVPRPKPTDDPLDTPPWK